MSLLILNESSSTPNTPSSNKGTCFFDIYTNLPALKNDAGRCTLLSPHFNAAVAAQGAGFATDTYVTNSDLIIPVFGLQAKSYFLWMISASKTAASTAQPVYSIRIGTGRATTDTARLQLTAPAQTAVADIGTLYVMVTVRSVGSGSSAVLQGSAWWAHRGTAANTTTSGTGFANDSTGHVEATSSGFDSSAMAGQYIGLSINGGTSASWTLTQCIGEANW